MDIPDWTPLVLLATSHGPLARILAVALRHAGFEVTDTRSAAEALAVLTVTPVHAVVLDAVLTGGLGTPVLEWLRRHRQNGHVLPVWVVISVWDEEETQSTVGPLGGPFLAKPFDPWRLAGLIESLLAAL